MQKRIRTTRRAEKIKFNAMHADAWLPAEQEAILHPSGRFRPKAYRAETANKEKMSHVDDALLELDRLYWPRTIMASLSGLYRQYEEPERLINTMNHGLKILPFISYAKIGSLFGYEKEAVAAYNDAVKLAYSCIGWEFVGLCSALVYGAPKTRRPWDKYVQAGEECLNAYFLSNEAFDDFEAYILDPARSVLAD